MMRLIYLYSFRSFFTSTQGKHLFGWRNNRYNIVFNGDGEKNYKTTNPKLQKFKNFFDVISFHIRFE